MNFSNLTSLIWIAEKLTNELRQEIVFLGGATTELFITDPIPPMPRPTKDVDAIIEVTTRIQYQRLGEQLRRLGFKEDTTQNAPLCRWRIEDLIFDIMPTNEEILGFTNTWYKQAIETSTLCNLKENLQIRLVAAPYFLATKLEAFFSRGNQDFLMSHDLEDILMVLNGRTEIWLEIINSDHSVRNYLIQSIKSLLAQEAFIDVIPAHLPMDERSEERARFLESKLRQLMTEVE